MSWRPISTLPHDGSDVLLADSDGICIVGRWEILGFRSEIVPSNVLSSYDMASVYSTIGDPVLWMPIPPITDVTP